MTWLDVSAPITAGMVHWPGDPPVRIELTSSIDAGDPANVTHLDMSAHTGTHVDAPRHFIADGAGIDSMPPAVGIGPARVVEASDVDGMVQADALREAGIGSGERVLLRTRNSDRDWAHEPFHQDFVGLSLEAAEHLAQLGPALVGVDYLSVTSPEPEQAAAVHRALLDAGVWIIEGLCLGRIARGDYELICLPLRLVGRDGAPARAMLRPLPD
jgi:arylformamidase